ncbi:unnamed protein product [Caenorhabditis sp. 36 PRJEB53466]|nr:unnamed protein product [Caenorhabditis sp. 36 PRJEB53466]
MTIEKKSPKERRRSKSTSHSKSKNGRGNTKSTQTKKSRMSEKSKSSQQKSVKSKMTAKSGLSPPKSKTWSKQAEPSDLGIDVTQWEYSHYKDEAKGIVNEDPNKYVTDKDGESTPFLAEQKQVTLVRGEHLKKKPLFTLFFLFVEIILTLTVLITWSFFIEYNEFCPVVLCFANLIILLIILLMVFVIQFGRFNVVEEVLYEDIRYRIPYQWKYWICVSHILRFFLTCTNITTGALDNNFDGGVIVLISGMPIMLILAAGHVFFALRPQG